MFGALCIYSASVLFQCLKSQWQTSFITAVLHFKQSTNPRNLDVDAVVPEHFLVSSWWRAYRVYAVFLHQILWIWKQISKDFWKKTKVLTTNRHSVSSFIDTMNEWSALTSSTVWSVQGWCILGDTRWCDLRFWSGTGVYAPAALAQTGPSLDDPTALVLP